MFVDRGRRRLAPAVVVTCIVALAFWWGMLALAFTEGTSGANPPLVGGRGGSFPAYERMQAVGGSRG